MSLYLPENNGKMFDDKRLFRANEGFEFEVRFRNSTSKSSSQFNASQSNALKPSVRFYTLSSEERARWVDAFRSRALPDVDTENIPIINLLGRLNLGSRPVLITEILLVGPPPKKVLKLMKQQEQMLLDKRAAEEELFRATSLAPYSPPPLPPHDEYSTYSSLPSNQLPHMYSNNYNRGGYNLNSVMQQMPSVRAHLNYQFNDDSTIGDSSFDEEEKGSGVDNEAQERLLIEQEARDREAVAREMYVKFQGKIYLLNITSILLHYYCTLLQIHDVFPTDRPRIRTCEQPRKWRPPIP